MAAVRALEQMMDQDSQPSKFPKIPAPLGIRTTYRRAPAMATAAAAAGRRPALLADHHEREPDVKSFSVPSLGSLPQIYETRAEAKAQLESMAQEVAAHYAVDFCVIAVQRADGSVSALACHGLSPDIVNKSRAGSDGSFSFFRHHIARDLPIIIGDAQNPDCSSRHDPLVSSSPGLRFYAAAPIRRGGSRNRDAYVGTLCIASSAPRPNFELEGCDVLCEKAAEASLVIARALGSQSQAAKLAGA